MAKLYSWHARRRTTLGRDIESLLKSANFPLPSVYKDVASIRRQSLQSVASTLVQLFKARDAHPLLADHLKSTIETYKMVFYEKTKNIKTENEQFILCEMNCLYLKPHDPQAAYDYGHLCGALLSAEAPENYHSRLGDNAPRLQVLKQQDHFKKGFIEALKFALPKSNLPQGREHYLHQIFHKSFGKGAKVSDVERSALIDFWKTIEPLPPNASKEVKEMREKTARLVPKEEGG